MTDTPGKDAQFTFILPYDALPVLKTAAKLMDRPILTGVHVNPEKGLIATADGFRMAYMPITFPENAWSCILPADTLLEGFKLAGVRNAQRHGVEVTVRGDDSFSVTSFTKSIEGDQIRGDFPDVLQIFNGSSVALRVFVNPDFLRDIGETYKKIGANAVGIGLSPDHLIIEFIGGETENVPVRVAVMPMEYSHGQGTPTLNPAGTLGEYAERVASSVLDTDIKTIVLDVEEEANAT